MRLAKGSTKEQIFESKNLKICIFFSTLIVNSYTTQDVNDAINIENAFVVYIELLDFITIMCIATETKL